MYNSEIEIGTVIEVFFVSELKKTENIEILFPQKEDFLVKINDKNYFFEIGGKNKKNYNDNTFIVKDNINISEGENIISLWLFGFLK